VGRRRRAARKLRKTKRRISDTGQGGGTDTSRQNPPAEEGGGRTSKKKHDSSASLGEGNYVILKRSRDDRYERSKSSPRLKEKIIDARKGRKKDEKIMWRERGGVHLY